ncbi:MAG: hypothetical protein HQK70_13305 [Desulfamplus sp.]|nr:hypothetical protein [Desulfamplus sp.]
MVGSKTILELFPKKHHEDKSYLTKWLEDTRLKIKEENKRICQVVTNSIVENFDNIKETKVEELALQILEAESTKAKREDALLKHQKTSELLEIIQQLDSYK